MPPAKANTSGREPRSVGTPPLPRAGDGLTGRGSDGGYSNTAGLAAPHCPLTIKTCVSAGRDESALLWPPLLRRFVYTGECEVYDIIRRSNCHQIYENPVYLNTCGSAPCSIQGATSLPVSFGVTSFAGGSWFRVGGSAAAAAAALRSDQSPCC